MRKWISSSTTTSSTAWGGKVGEAIMIIDPAEGVEKGVRGILFFVLAKKETLLKEERQPGDAISGGVKSNI
jgi:hypothetical protein